MTWYLRDSNEIPSLVSNSSGEDWKLAFREWMCWRVEESASIDSCSKVAETSMVSLIESVSTDQMSNGTKNGSDNGFLGRRSLSVVHCSIKFSEPSAFHPAEIKNCTDLTGSTVYGHVDVTLRNVTCVTSTRTRLPRQYEYLNI